MTFSITFCLEKIRIKEYSECEIDSALIATCILKLFFLKKSKSENKSKSESESENKSKSESESKSNSKNQQINHITN